MPATTTSAHGAGGVIAATKLQVPPARLELVAREALVALIAGAGPHTRLTLLSAPAGSGKTTLLTLWNLSAAEDRPFAWLSLDASDNDPVRFWSGVLEALRTVVPGAGAVAEGALLSPGSDLRDVVVPLLVNEAVGWHQPVVLVLDDLHVVTDAAVHASLSHLIERLPYTLQLAIATRTDPDLPLGRLRARGQLVEVRAGHLRFSDAEATAFLNGGLGLDLADGEIAQIQARTEGWAAGLQLAGLSLRGRERRAEFLASFAGDDRHVLDYLSGEILVGVEPGLRAFLARTSILDRMSAELCEAVTREPGAAGRLAELERRNLFTSAMDPQRRWYRYHPLFADVVRAELARTEPGLVAELHRRASAWWAAEGFVADAIAHALTGGESDTATELVAAHWSEFFNRGWLTTVAQWLRALPEDALERDSRLWLARAWTAMDSGALGEVEPWLKAGDGGGGRQAWVDVLRALHRFKTGDVGAAAADARHARRAPGDGSAFWTTVAALAFGVAVFWGEGPPAAATAFEDALALAEADGNGLAANYALGYLALGGAQRGLAGEAGARLEAADALVEREPPLDEHFTGMVRHLARGRLDERAGRLDAADAALRRAVELSRRGAGIVERGAALVAHARVLGALGRREEARAALDAAVAALDPCPDAGSVRAELEAARRAVAPAPRAPSAPGEELSDSERRVLALLPSDLSLREIGAELYVSLNTVKTHTRNIYAKLDARGRDEAVARGRELGLL
jgi:ATP/maltotriose-dependent transcriptional regulator MalT